MAAKKETLPKFHAKIAAPSRRRHRTTDAKDVYNLIVAYWLDLYDKNLYHPKMPKITFDHMSTIVHNIGRLMADEITRAQECHRKAMAREKNKAIKEIVKKQNATTNKSTKSIIKCKTKKTTCTK